MKTYAMLLIAVLLLFISIPISSQDEPGLSEENVTHVVQAGENLYRIALRYGVDMNELAQANDITNMSRIYRGQVLVIPGLAVPATDAEEVNNPLIAGTPTVHVVTYGETVSTIANAYGITVEQLLQGNNIANPNLIYRGQELQIWTPESVSQEEELVEEQTIEETAPELVEGVAPEQNITYTVQAGEGLAEIALRFGMDLSTLAQANGILDVNRVYVGQVLTIPALNGEGDIIDMGIITLPDPGATIADGKQIIVDLSDSMTYAYEDGVLVFSTIVSTGLPSTPTVTGEFTIYHRLRSQTMSGPGYYLPNVEYVQYFYQGYALHGTYWHENFGEPMSHGCVNMTNSDAQWFYEWADYGTPVLVQY